MLRDKFTGPKLRGLIKHKILFWLWSNFS